MLGQVFQQDGMPESDQNRLRRTWEHLFFTRQPSRYYFDLDAIREPVPCRYSSEVQDTVPGERTVPGFGPPASRGVLSWDGATASGLDHQEPGTIAS